MRHVCYITMRRNIAIYLGTKDLWVYGKLCGSLQTTGGGPLAASDDGLLGLSYLVWHVPAYHFWGVTSIRKSIRKHLRASNPIRPKECCSYYWTT